MAKYPFRLLVGILAFSIGTATTYFTVGDEIRAPHKPTHSSESNSPYSLLEGTTIRIRPYDATFDIPESWLARPRTETSAMTLHLSRQELNELFRNNRGDEEDAQVLKSVLPYEDCAAHFGNSDWGNYLWNDLQGRVYIVDFTPQEITARIEQRGLRKASSLFAEDSLTWENHCVWQKLRLDVMDAPSHFVLMKSLNFYYRSFGNKTVVFIFVHAGGFDKTIEGILSSFKWSTHP